MKKVLVAVVVACGFAAFANEWYIDAENGDDTAAGTQGAPRKTLKGAMEIPDLAANDTIWLLPGDYNVGEMPYFDAKVSDMTYASTNRCFITKPGLKIRSTGGKDVTFVTGAKDPNQSTFSKAYGGTRCFLIAAEATGVIIEGLTIRTGYAPYVQATPFSYGGGVLDRSKSCWVVDCKFSGGRASRGGGQAYGNALRTEYIDTAAEGRGTAVQDVNMLVNCAIRNTGGIAPIDGSASMLVNCLITATKSKNALSQDAKITAYNSIFVGNTMGGNGTKKASTFSNCVVGPFIVGAYTNDNVTCESCVTNATVDDVAWANSTTSPYDWRTMSTSVARGVGDAAFLATIQVPEGYSVYTDLYGTPIPTEGMIAAGPAQPANWYVDATDGNDDDHGGRTLADAFKTIRKATSVAGAGDTIHVAPGVYGEAEGAQVIDGQSVGNRVLLPAGVTLESLEGAEKTFIVGAADPDAYTASYGTGPKAIRCVHAVGVDTHIRGFTLTGGHSNSNTTDTVAADAYGSAVYSSSSGGAYAYVEDCIISNNVVNKGTLYCCRAIRSRVTQNRSLLTSRSGAVGDSCYWYGCIIDANIGKAAMNSPKWIESCTIKQASGSSNSQIIFGGCPIYNSVLLTGTTYELKSATNCMFSTDATTIASSYRAGCIDCVITNTANMTVDSKFSPVFGSYAGIDAGSVERASISYLGDKDIYGNPRVMNGKMDIGAVEYDWRPNYAALLGQGVTVETVSSAVHSTDDAVVVPSGSTLAGTLTRVGTYVVSFRVTGEGRATLKLGGEVFGEYAAGEYAFEVETSGGAFEFTFDGSGALEVGKMTYDSRWYVDGTLGNDDNDGRTTKTPKATIRAATTNAVAGDVIHVAPGDYGEAEGSRLQSKVETRVIVPEGVRLQADGAPYSAVIHGAAASEPEDAYGNGPDAVRCVYLSAGATLANFTLMDGHTPTNTYGIGSAVYAANNTTATVTDCLVTNNFGYLGTLYKGNIVRCRVVKNRAIERSCIGDNGRYYGCFFDKSYSRIRPLYQPVSIDFCTLGPGLDVYSGSQIIGPATKTVMRNSVMMYGTIYLPRQVYATNCVWTSDSVGTFAGISNCVTMALADMKLSADGVPAADSPLNNWGDMGIYPDCVNETDLLGVPRVMNGGVDAGAYEHDWRVEYKNDLGARATAVTAASPMVVETEDHTVRIPSGTLAGTLKTSGATMLNFTVKGGTLAVYLGETLVGEYGAADAEQGVELWPSEGNNTLRLAFTPNDKDGYAEIARLTKGASGIIFMVR